MADAKLLAAIKQSTAGPVYFALAAKGADSRLLASKIAIPGGDVSDLKAKTPGCKIYKGQCFREDGAIVFQFADPPPDPLAKVIKEVLHRDCDLTLKVVLRGPDAPAAAHPQEAPNAADPQETAAAPAGGASAAVQSDAAPDVASVANATDTPAAATPEAVPPVDAKAAAADSAGSGVVDPQAAYRLFLESFKAAKPEIEKLVAAGTASSPAVKVALGEITEAARKHEFERANGLMEAIAPLLARARGEAGAGNGAVAVPVDGARYAARLAELTPAIKQAITSGTPAGMAIKARLIEATALSRKQDFAAAGLLLEEAAAILAQPSGSVAAQTPTAPNPETPPTGRRVGPRVAFTQSRLAWDSARKKVQAELQKLVAAILSMAADEPDFDAIREGAPRLLAMLEILDERLIDKLDDALGAETAEKRDAFHAEARAIVEEYRGFVNGDDLLAAIDTNGFIPVAVRSTLVPTLDDLATRLAV